MTTYNGWKNRETWALNLWLSNDAGLYEMTRERVREACPDRWLSMVTTAEAGRHAGEAVKDMFEELTDPDEGLMSAEAILQMVRDIGSEYRIDWDGIGAHWLADVEEG